MRSYVPTRVYRTGAQSLDHNGFKSHLTILLLQPQLYQSSTPELADIPSFASWQPLRFTTRPEFRWTRHLEIISYPHYYTLTVTSFVTIPLS